MSDVGLSQAEIDALLGGAVDSPPAAAAPGGTAFSGAQTEALAAFERESLGNLAGVINAMTGFEYNLDGVEAASVSSDELAALVGDDLIYRIPVTVGEECTHLLVLEPGFAKMVAAALTGGDPGGEDNSLSDLEISAVSEVVSTVNGTYMTNVASALKVATNAGAASLVDLAAAAGELSAAAGVMIGLKLSQNGDSPTVVRHILPADLVQRILTVIMPAPKPVATAAASPPPTAKAAGPAPGLGAPPASSGSIAPSDMSYAPAAFSQLGPAPMPDIEMRNLDLLLDVPLTITVELGKTTVPIRQILEYGQGSLIALDKLAGEPIDLLVNGKYFARGEVVVIDENFGVRLTSILSASERLSQLT
ncbi:flagellar motor switch protein FliN [bacterium]|nr:flagellar motor switch protein FliN [bacterium]